VVTSLRKGLDLQGVKQYTDLPPFDTQGAHYLYQQLVAPVAEALQGVTHVIAVLDGAMQNLPPAVLLASPATTPPQRWEDYQKLDFLGRHYAFSVVPSVSALQALRAVVKPSRSSLPFLGFGDPVLGGSETPTRGTRGTILEALVTSIDPTLIRTQMTALPETREELQALATTLNASSTALFLGPQATETRLKQLDLARYSIVAFATHGLLAGDFRGLAEPALVLTPPQHATAVDDGLLTASEIAMLPLDANWVLLSACNTAGPEGRPGAEGLSGLAKAFFYAGSRALLVSHWSVASDTTVLLTTGALQALMQEPAMGRAEALRRAMLRLMNGEGHPRYAHPAFWAPFVNVGEGKGAIR
jgi:CHAT domain-containing protein